MNRNKLQRGFTLLEISIVMIIAVALAVITTRGLYLKINHNSVEHTAAEIWSIGEGAQHWISTHDEWPGEGNSCTNAITALNTIYFGGIPTQSPWDTPYITSCVPGESFSIQVQLDDNWAPALMNMLAVTRILPGTSDTTITTLPLPGSISALTNVLKRTADPAHPEYNRMETDLDMGYFDIENVEIIRAKRLDVNSIDSRLTINALSGAQNGNPVFALNAYGKDEYAVVQPEGSEPRKKNGSVNLNDMYMRSVGGYISSRLSDMVEKTSYVAIGGDLVPKPQCPHNSSVSPAPIPKIRVRPASDSNSTVDFGVIDDVEYWQVRGATIVNAEVYCYYPPLHDPGYEEVIQDTTPPSAPINFALASTSNAGTANFSVTPNTELDFYRYILRKVSGVGGYTNLSFGDPNGIQMSALTEGNPYTYHLIAVDHAGNESDPSNSVAFTIVHPPAAPAGLRFMSGIGEAAAFEVTANREADIAGYRFYFSNGGPSGAVQSDPNALWVGGLTQRSSYTVYVKAVDNAGNESPQSNQVTFNSGTFPF